MLEGKLRWDLAPWRGFVGCVEAMMHGIKKHGGEWDWLENANKYKFSSRFASAQRHMLKWWFRENFDESGLLHLKHAIAQLSMLVEYIERGMNHLDDRPPACTTRSDELAKQNPIGDRPHLPPPVPIIPRRCDHLSFRYYRYTAEGRTGPYCDDCYQPIPQGQP